MEKISVIVPVYNVDNYLERCLTSLLEQDYHDYEILVVNDASTDSSLSICKQYAENSNKIKLINLKTNQGLYAARNIGLKHCSGQYVAFVDSDDFVSSNFLSSMHTIMKDKKTDIVCCNHSYCWDNKNFFEIASPNQKSQPLSRLDFIQIVFTLKSSKRMGISFGGFVWNKLFRRDLLENIFFEHTDGAEDELFLSKVFSKINTIYYVGQPLYFYNLRQNSLSHNNCFIIEHLKTRFQICNNLKSTPDFEICSSALYQHMLNTAPCFLSNNKLTINDLITYRQIYNSKLWNSCHLYSEGPKLRISQILTFILTHLNTKLTMQMIQLLRPVYKAYKLF